MGDSKELDEATSGGDLAQRITARRLELGLSREELAARARMDPGYLDYLEHRAGAVVTAGAMLRLAAALESTLFDLGGGAGSHHAAGHAVPGEARLDALSPDECRARLAAGEIGRVVYCAARGPIAYPVNYAVVGNDILISTSQRTAEQIASAGDVGFEVDRIDEVRQEGWSVLATGRARPSTGAARRPNGTPGDPHAPASADEHGRVGARDVAPVPWARGSRDSIVRIEIGEITGRALHRQAPNG